MFISHIKGQVNVSQSITKQVFIVAVPKLPGTPKGVKFSRIYAPPNSEFRSQMGHNSRVSAITEEMLP